MGKSQEVVLEIKSKQKNQGHRHSSSGGVNNVIRLEHEAMDTDRMSETPVCCRQKLIVSCGTRQKETLRRMEQEKVNMFGIRKFEISSIRQKIETRALERLGHVIRMADTRLAKKIILGRWDEPKRTKQNIKDSISSYWRRLLAEAGEDWTNIPNLAKSRKKWKELVNRRKRQILDWEEEMCNIHRVQSKPPRAQPRQTTEIFECR